MCAVGGAVCLTTKGILQLISPAISELSMYPYAHFLISASWIWVWLPVLFMYVTIMMTKISVFLGH